MRFFESFVTYILRLTDLGMVYRDMHRTSKSTRVVIENSMVEQITHITMKYLVCNGHTRQEYIYDSDHRFSYVHVWMESF